MTQLAYLRESPSEEAEANDAHDRDHAQRSEESGRTNKERRAYGGVSR